MTEVVSSFMGKKRRFDALKEVIDFYNRGGDNSGFMGKKRRNYQIT